MAEKIEDFKVGDFVEVDSKYVKGSGGKAWIIRGFDDGTFKVKYVVNGQDIVEKKYMKHADHLPDRKTKSIGRSDSSDEKTLLINSEISPFKMTKISSDDSPKALDKARLPNSAISSINVTQSTSTNDGNSEDIVLSRLLNSLEGKNLAVGSPQTPQRTITPSSLAPIPVTQVEKDTSVELIREEAPQTDFSQSITEIDVQEPSFIEADIKIEETKHDKVVTENLPEQPQCPSLKLFFRYTNFPS